VFNVIHGGPHTMWRDAWVTRWNYHLLGAPGCVVLLTNDSGSTGFGERDFRVPLHNSLEDWTALQRRQVPSRRVVFPEENHGVLQREERSAVLSRGACLAGPLAGGGGCGDPCSGFVMRRELA